MLPTAGAGPPVGFRCHRMLATLPAHLRSQVTAESTSSLLALFAPAVSSLGATCTVITAGRTQAAPIAAGHRATSLCVSHTAFDYPLKSDLGAEVSVRRHGTQIWIGVT